MGNQLVSSNNLKIFNYYSNGFHTLNIQAVYGHRVSLFSEEDERGYETDLSLENTDMEVNRNTSDWSNMDKKNYNT